MLFWFKIFLISFFLVFSLRLRFPIGLSLIISSILIGIFYYPSLETILKLIVKSLSSYPTLKTILIIYSVLLLTNIVKNRGMENLAENLLEIFKDVKYAIIFSPMIVGLLPMPGGALFTAGIVNEIGKKTGLRPEEKTFINYWFRHIWEYIWPLYPGLILVSTIMNVSIKSIIEHQFYLTFIAFFIGLFFVKRLKSFKIENKKDIKKTIFNIFDGFLPIIVIVMLIFFTNIKEELIIFSVSIFFLLLLKINFKKKISLLFKSFSIEMMLLIVGVMIFKDFFSNSETIKQNFLALQNNKALEYIFLIFSPLLVGFFTGINQAYVGILLPMVVPIILKNGNIDFQRLTLFYASGFVGVLLSPVHLCLSLTKEYFKADWFKVYKILLPSTIPILLIPLILEIIF